jgi:hypothetical protein
MFIMTQATQHVSWYDPDAEFYGARARKRHASIEGLFKFVETQQEVPSLRDLSDLFYELAGAMLVSGASADVITELLQRSARFGAAFFDFVLLPPDTEKEVELEKGRTVTLKKVGSIPGGTDISFFNKAFYTSVICRELELAHRLSEVPINVTRYAQAMGEADMYIFATALQHYWRQEPDTPALLEQTLGSLSSSDIRSIARTKAIHALLNRDSQLLNECLLQILQSHRELHERKNGGAKFFICIDALFLAVLAHDQELEVTVTSDYLPEYLVNGSFTTTKAIPTPGRPIPEFPHLQKYLDVIPTEPAPARYTDRTITLVEEEEERYVDR